MKPFDSSLFQQQVWEYYRDFGRYDLPWRQPEAEGTFDPYKIMVSELMLQQTQVPRVVLKYHEFLQQFPTVDALASAPLGQVLTAWSGLGYNRRAKFLWQAAQAIQKDGHFPESMETLVRLPGIGFNTAGAILTYAFNQPHVFIETNVRTVFIHHFFKDEINIPDSTLTELVRATLPGHNYREWYWALMDYGTHLKHTIGNASRQSKLFTKQSTFEGSKRQIRGTVLKLLKTGELTKAQLVKQISDDRLPAVLADLGKEGLIVSRSNSYRLP